jgi:transcription antitermination factor NusG
VKAEPAIVEGDRVEIVKGALAGLSGIVVRRDSNYRLFVEVKVLGRSVSVQIENWMLQKY